jgi:hypothetical protein
MSTYVLHDSRYETYLSRGDSFNRQWMSYIQQYNIVKFAPVSMNDFTNDDTVIIYLDNSKPYGNYKLIPGMKKIFIVGELRKDNIDYLKEANHVIYMSPLQHKVAIEYGIDTAHTICPHHPFPSIDISIPKRNMVFIGGIFNVNKSTGFENRLLKLHKSTPLDWEFNVYLGGQGGTYKANTNELYKWLIEHYG